MGETLGIAVLDAIRYFTIGEGITLMTVSAFSVIDAWMYAWPRKLRFGIGLRWLGRFGLVTFGSIFTWHRLHMDLNWYTPWTCVTFTVLLAGIWLTRDYDFLWRDKAHGHDEPEPELKLREPL